MSSNLQNSIWPNEGGTLGQIKVQIPTGTANDPWPTGDALVNYFVFNKGKLVGLVDTKALIANSSKTTTFPYEYVNISLPSIAEGEMTYNYDQCTYVVLNGEVLKGDVPTNEELEIITKKYIGCLTVDDIKAVDPNYLTNDIIDGVWKEGLGDLTNGHSMFYRCIALTSFASDLSSLTDGYAMFDGCSQLKSFNSDLSSLSDGRYMFNECTALTSFTSDLPSLTDGYQMFYHCTNLKSFTSDLSSLTDCYAMFNGCTNLTSFSSALPSLKDGEKMFFNCTNLKSFTSDLSSLTYGYRMFYWCTNLTTFSSDLSSLVNGEWMFRDCSNLTTFNSDLPNLWNGMAMFDGCSNLTSFNSDLSKLSDGYCMFQGCKLDTASVQNIADTINNNVNPSSASIFIDIGNSQPNEQETEAFNKIKSKGWTVYVNGSNGSSCCASCASCCASCASCYDCCASGCPAQCCATSCASLMTLDETDGEFVAPKPYWAKPVPSDEEHAQYVDSQGNFYNILGAQFIYGDNLETYGMFTSIYDAAAQMRLKKIGEIEIETA